MPIEPTLVQWIIALLLLAVFAWVLMGLVLDIVPTPGIRADEPRKKMMGYALLAVTGLVSYSVSKEVLVWVWRGLRHVLGLDLEGL